MEQTPAQNDTAPAAEQVTIKEFVMTNYKAIIIVVVGLFLISAYFHQLSTSNALKQQNQHLANPGASAKAQASDLRNEVSKLIDLPSNETPTIATVVDPSKLQNQSFFTHAKTGDKVLMFAQAKEAVLYRPSTHKIIQIAPINLGSTGAAGSSAGDSLSSGN